MFLIEDEVLMG